MALPTKQHGGNVSHLLPSELVDKCVGSRIWVRPRLQQALRRCKRSSRLPDAALCRGAALHCEVLLPEAALRALGGLENAADGFVRLFAPFPRVSR